MRQKLYFKLYNSDFPDHGHSSTIHKIRYDDMKKTMYVDFHNGNSYKYPNVPADVYESAVASESISTFLHANVYKKYKSDKVK